VRAPKRHRPRRRSVVPAPGGTDLTELAARASYVGSPEHKSYPSYAGGARLRADATRCDPSLTDRDELTRWLRAAIGAGRIGEPWEGDFPRYAWHRLGDVCYEARLVNQELGQYKGYPLDPSEQPEGM
jgi:hypothetical protein